MNIIETLFFIQFFLFLTIFFLKTYNLMQLGKFYDIKIAFLLLIGSIMFWGFGLLSVMLHLTNLNLSIFFKFETYFLILNGLFMMSEMFIYLKDHVAKPVTCHNSMEARGT